MNPWATRPYAKQFGSKAYRNLQKKPALMIKKLNPIIYFVLSLAIIQHIYKLLPCCFSQKWVSLCGSQHVFCFCVILKFLMQSKGTILCWDADMHQRISTIFAEKQNCTMLKNRAARA